MKGFFLSIDRLWKMAHIFYELIVDNFLVVSWGVVHMEDAILYKWLYSLICILYNKLFSSEFNDLCIVNFALFVFENQTERETLVFISWMEL